MGIFWGPNGMIEVCTYYHYFVIIIIIITIIITSFVGPNGMGLSMRQAGWETLSDEEAGGEGVATECHGGCHGGCECHVTAMGEGACSNSLGVVEGGSWHVSICVYMCLLWHVSLTVREHIL